MTAALAILRRRWYVVVGAMLGLAYFAVLTVGAIQDGQDRRRSRQRIENLAKRIDDTTAAIENATSPEARARGDATLAFAIAEIRRSIDCVAFYVNNERPPACAEIAARMDAIRAGDDPFPTRTPQTGAP